MKRAILIVLFVLIFSLVFIFALITSISGGYYKVTTLFTPNYFDKSIQKISLTEAKEIDSKTDWSYSYQFNPNLRRYFEVEKYPFLEKYNYSVDYRGGTTIRNKQLGAQVNPLREEYFLLYTGWEPRVFVLFTESGSFEKKIDIEKDPLNLAMSSFDVKWVGDELLLQGITRDREKDSRFRYKYLFNPFTSNIINENTLTPLQVIAKKPDKVNMDDININASNPDFIAGQYCIARVDGFSSFCYRRGVAILNKNAEIIKEVLILNTRNPLFTAWDTNDLLIKEYGFSKGLKSMYRLSLDDINWE